MNNLESILLGVVQWSSEKTANVRVAGVRLTPDEAQQQIKILFQELILSANKKAKGDETSYELAELNGRSDTLLELFKKLEEL